MLGGEERLECEVCVEGIRLKNFSEFKYWGFVLDESGTDEAVCSRKLVSGRRVAVAIRCLQFERTRVYYESLLVLVLMYGSETMIWEAKERSRIKVVQMDNLRGLVGTRRVNEVPNAR